MTLRACGLFALTICMAGPCRSQDSSMTAERLAGAVLRLGHSAATWTFGTERFELRFRRDRARGLGFSNHDRALARDFLGDGEFPPRHPIRGRWRLTDDGCVLLLTEIAAGPIRLPLVRLDAAGLRRGGVVLGPHRYLLQPLEDNLVGDYVQAGNDNLRLRITSQGWRGAPPTGMVLHAAGAGALSEHPLVTKFGRGQPIRERVTCDVNMRFKQGRAVLSNIIADEGEPQPGGLVLRISAGTVPDTIELAGTVFHRALSEADAFRLVTYNVWYGFTKRPGRKRMWLSWMADKTPDVVVLQELNTYTADRLLKDARHWSHDHVALLKDDGFATGVTSLTPITDIRRFRDGFHHGLMRVQTAGYYVYVVHLHPSNWETRVRETRLLLADLKKLPDDARVLVAGDFNTFSPDDEAVYRRGQLEAFFEARDKKFGERNLREGKLDYTPIRLLLEAGLIDQEPRFRRSFQGTFPTPIPKSGEHGEPRRLDYVFANKRVSPDVIRAWSVVNTNTDRLSDHYPVVIDIRQNKKPTGKLENKQ